MLDNVTYDKVKILSSLSQICWFIEKHALENAQKAGNDTNLELLKAMEQDLHKHIQELQKGLCKT